jgi:hypothetical protein
VKIKMFLFSLIFSLAVVCNNMKQRNVSKGLNGYNFYGLSYAVDTSHFNS